MAYLDYDGDTTGKVALLDKVKVMLAEIYTTYIAEIEAARDGEVSLLAQIDSLQADIGTVTTEVTNARDGEANLLAQIDSLQSDISTVTTEVTNARDGEATLVAQIDSLQADIAALTAGSSCPVSANDTNPGYLDGKLLEGSGISFTVGNEGADETLTIAVTGDVTDNLANLGNAATSRTNLGGTTVGSNLFTLTNPSAVTFPRMNADNSVSARTASEARSDLGATTTGGNVFTITNPGVVSFLRVNADSTVTARTIAEAKTDLDIKPGLLFEAGMFGGL